MFFSKKFPNIKKQVNFPRLPRKFRVIAIGIPEGLQQAIQPLLRQHNAEIKYVDNALKLLNEPRMADVLLVYPIDMGINRRLSQRLKHVRIQLRYEAEGNNDALHVLQLAIQVSTNPGSYQELKNRVDRFDDKWNAQLEQPAEAPEGEVLNVDLSSSAKPAVPLDAEQPKKEE